MAGIIEFRRGNTATIASLTPLSGELLVDIDAPGDLRVGDAATAGGNIVGGRIINAQTGVSYSVNSSDQGKLVTLSNGSAVAVMMPQAGITNNFQNGATVEFLNLGAGTVTITPTTSTINGAATLVLPTGWGALVRSNGTNYNALVIAAAEGGIGAVIESLLLVGSAILLTTATPANVTSISLTVGEWEVSGTVGFSENAATIATEEIAAINTVSATLPTFPADGASTSSRSGTGATGIGSVLPVAPCRITVATGATTVYLVAQAVFSVNTDAAYGQIRAVRVG